MVKAISLLLLAPATIDAFAVGRHTAPPSILRMTATESLDTQAVDVAPKETLLDVASKLKEEFGLFLVDSTAKADLSEAVEALEMTQTEPVASEALDGDWDLLCTTTTTPKGFDTSRFLPGPLKQLSDRISATTNKYVTVKQNIKKDEEGILNRIDHVLAYQPPQALTEFLDNLPEPLTTLNVNPLDVSQSKLVLVHKASAENDQVTLRLQSVIWNVAGNSTYLDPAGKDITSINLPWGEFLGSGTFKTTYMDDDIRISRGKQGFIDVLRVFVKAPAETDLVMDVDDIPDAEIIDDIIMAEDATDADDDIPSDVGVAGP